MRWKQSWVSAFVQLLVLSQGTDALVCGVEYGAVSYDKKWLLSLRLDSRNYTWRVCPAATPLPCPQVVTPKLLCRNDRSPGDTCFSLQVPKALGSGCVCFLGGGD